MPNVAAPVRRNLWGIRLHYFICIGGGGFLIPFVGLFFRRQGLSGTEIGLLSTMSAVAALLAAPLWGRWSDRAASRRRVLQVALVATALTVMALSQQRVFGWMALVVSVQALAGAGAEPLSDTLALDVTRGASQHGFGSVRVWGSLGWALIVSLGGWLVERTSLFVGFVGYAASLAVSALILELVNLAPSPARSGAAAPRTSVWSVARGLMQDPGLVGLAVALMIVWLSSDGLMRFEAIFLDQLGAGESLIGLANATAAVVELPAMFWADRLVKRLGPGPVLRMGLVLDALARGLVLAWPAVPAIFIRQAVAGMSFSFYSVAVVVFVSTHAPAQQSATALAFYAVTLRSLIQILGGPLNGLAFDAFGAYWLYAIGLGGNVLGWLALRFTMANHNDRRFFHV